MGRAGTQVTLDPERYQAVTELAQTQERPVTDVVQEVFDLGLEQLRRRKQRKSKALAELNALRSRLESQSGVYSGNPVEEVRAERERQINDVLSRAIKS